MIMKYKPHPNPVFLPETLTVEEVVESYVAASGDTSGCGLSRTSVVCAHPWDQQQRLLPPERVLCTQVV
jgi:hypothetical protein